MEEKELRKYNATFYNKYNMSHTLTITNLTFDNVLKIKQAHKSGEMLFQNFDNKDAESIMSSIDTTQFCLIEYKVV